MSSLRVGVIMGGRGNEKEVSFNSGRTVCDHLDSFRYTVVPLFQRSNGSLFILPARFLHRGKTSDFEHRLDAEAEKITWDSLKERIDFMYIAMHGRYAEDGTLQGFLEVLGIPYLGSKVMASALGMDKIMQKKVLKSHAIRVPQGIVIKPHELSQYEQNPEQLIQQIKKSTLQAPYFVKPAHEGSSLGISTVFSTENLLEAVIKAATINPNALQAALIEEFIQGMEFTCITITDYKTGKLVSLAPTEIVPEAASHFLDYEQKYMPGRSTKFTPARCSQELIQKIQATCIEVSQILGIENISRIDGFVTPQGEIVITDPNTLCGMAPSSFVFRQAAESDMSHTGLINHLIETELAHYGMLEALHETEKQGKKQMDNQQKKRVGILLGGRSHEREISLESGRNVFYKLSPQKYDPVALFVDKNLELYRIDQPLLVRNSTKEIELGLDPSMKVAWNDLPQLFDFIFIALHGGEGENGCVQGTLEMLELPYNGSGVLTSALCMDKYKTSDFLRSQGFEVPCNYLVEKKNWVRDRAAEVAAITKIQNGAQAFIIKPHDDGCSVMVQKARTEEEIIKAVDAIFADGKQCALVEECITGMELTVGVLGNTRAQALPPSQAVTTQGILSIEEKFLPGAGENQTPAPIPQDALHFVKKTIEAVYTALNCKGYSRIDCFYQRPEENPTGAERLVIIEINTLPGLTPATCIFHQAAEIGLKPMEFIDVIVELGLEEKQSRRVVVTRSTHSHTATSAPALLEKL